MAAGNGTTSKTMMASDNRVRTRTNISYALLNSRGFLVFSSAMSGSLPSLSTSGAASATTEPSPALA